MSRTNYRNSFVNTIIGYACAPHVWSNPIIYFNVENIRFGLNSSRDVPFYSSYNYKHTTIGLYTILENPFFTKHL